MSLMGGLRTLSGSIAGRLTLWLTTASLLILLAKSALTYWVMAPVLSAQEELYVSARARQIGAHVAASMAGGGKPAFESLLSPDTPGFVRILTADGKVLAEAEGMAEEFPDTGQDIGDHPVMVQGRSGRQYWIAASMRNGDVPVVVQVATVANEFRIMAPWGGRLTLATVLALILSGYAGFRIARHGIRPLQELAETVHAIGSSTLERRIDPARQPIELQPLCRTFNSMLDRLQQSFDQVSQFTDDIAHELRTPLSVMASQIDVTLASERSAPEYREILESTREEISALSDLVQRLLFLSRVENQSVPLHLERLDLGHELALVQEFYEALAAEAGVALDVAPQPVPVQMGGDRILLRRAIGNLAVNAIRHTPAGGHVLLAAEPQGTEVCITVSDSGSGIPAEMLPRLFDRFFRLDRARETGEGHVGLGMAIVKAIAQLHGGRVGVFSRVGEGTTVTLCLPAGKCGPDGLSGSVLPPV
ncbi:MAG: heavy metal sensor histidine kinase [Magnetospirillum sp.]|nr:heavy metal sensor histidine kinase [Magnetospirillum sp.]